MSTRIKNAEEESKVEAGEPEVSSVVVEGVSIFDILGDMWNSNSKKVSRVFLDGFHGYSPASVWCGLGMIMDTGSVVVVSKEISDEECADAGNWFERVKGVRGKKEYARI